VFGTLETYVGCGIVGGVLLDVKHLAEDTARMALRILEQGSTTGSPIQRSFSSQTVVDWRQLQRWNIPVTRLPAETIVQYRDPTFWEQYKRYALSGATAIVAQLVLIIVLVRERRKRRAVDLVAKSLNGRFINVCEEERKRIARELHDDIGQRLSLVSLDLDVMEQDAANGATARLSLEEPLQQLSEIITDVHNLSHQLHSTKLQTLGLDVAVKEVCRQFGRQHDVEIRFTAEKTPFPLPEDVGLCFYRVAQEALSNSVKHSGATHIDVRLVASDGLLRMIVEDDGSGFDPSAAANGLGLATMRERLRLVDGTLLVNSMPGRGTEITAQARLSPSSTTTAAA
jgi:signal transduction histidine kinase